MLFRSVTEEETILLAASAEMHAVHPLAVAIQQYVKMRGWEVPQHKSSKTVVARGMEARVPNFGELGAQNAVHPHRRTKRKRRRCGDRPLPRRQRSRTKNVFAQRLCRLCAGKKRKRTTTAFDRFLKSAFRHFVLSDMADHDVLSYLWQRDRKSVV